MSTTLTEYDEAAEEKKALGRLRAQTLVNERGELMVSASKVSRGAVMVAFEMMGGVEEFANWAMLNPHDFYTKMFGKTIGREVEHSQATAPEDILDILDGEAEDITDLKFEDLPAEDAQQPAMDLRLSRMAGIYAEGEDIDG